MHDTHINGVIGIHIIYKELPNYDVRCFEKCIMVKESFVMKFKMLFKILL